MTFTQFQYEILCKCEDATLVATLRGMMKRVMTRSLAVTFSFTGMDGKRLKTKNCLKEHAVYKVLRGTSKVFLFESAAFVEVHRFFWKSLTSAKESHYLHFIY